MSIHDSSPLNCPSQDEYHSVRDFFCLSSNGSLYDHPLIASDSSSSPPWLPAYHLSSGPHPCPMIFPHWNVVHRDTQNDRRIMTGTESPFSGRFDITIVGRGNRLWFVSMCPAKASNGDWIGYPIWLGADITKFSCPLRSTSYALRTASVIRSWTRVNARLHIPYVLEYSGVHCVSAWRPKGMVVRTLEYTRRLRICWDMGIQSMIVSPVIDGEENAAIRYLEITLATKACRI